MGREEFELLRPGVIKRKAQRRIGLFVNGVGLDRATRRISRKVDIKGLVSGLSSGVQIEISRYYTLVPYVDDARQVAFLDAVERAGLHVVSKRLPPKGVTRQVSIDVQMATDLTAFCFGHFEKKDARAVTTNGNGNGNGNGHHTEPAAPAEQETPVVVTPASTPTIKREAIVICPGRELSYAIFSAHESGIVTTLADFGLYGKSDGWPGVDRWVDLSTSETIWRD